MNSTVKEELVSFFGKYAEETRRLWYFKALIHVTPENVGQINEAQAIAWVTLANQELIRKPTMHSKLYFLDSAREKMFYEDLCKMYAMIMDGAPASSTTFITKINPTTSNLCPIRAQVLIESEKSRERKVVKDKMRNLNLGIQKSNICGWNNGVRQKFEEFLLGTKEYKK